MEIFYSTNNNFLVIVIITVVIFIDYSLKEFMGDVNE